MRDPGEQGKRAPGAKADWRLFLLFMRSRRSRVIALIALALIILSVVLYVAESSALAPFIYPLF